MSRCEALEGRRLGSAMGGKLGCVARHNNAANRTIAIIEKLLPPRQNVQLCLYLASKAEINDSNLL
jgi:hypothetical protein